MFILGATTGFASWWLGFVWFVRVWPKPQFGGMSRLLARAVELSNPDSEQSFFEAYKSLLHETVRIAWYRIQQSAVALVPFGMGLWLTWAADYSWTYIAVTTVTSLVVGICSLFSSSRRANPHETDSQ